MSIEELETLDCVKYLPTNDRSKLSNFRGNLRDKIQKTRDPLSAEILLQQWIDLGVISARPDMRDVMEDNIINYLFPQSQKGSILYNCLLCMRLSRGNNFPYSSMNGILQEEDEELSTNLAQKYIQIFTTYEDLLLMYSSLGGYPLYKGIVRALISNHLGQVLSIENVIPHYKGISQTIDIPIDRLLTDWDRWKRFFEKGITEQTISTIPVDFFRDTTGMKQLQIVSHCNQMAVRYLQAITQNDWIDLFQNENYAYELLMSLRCDCPNAYEAFKQIIKTELEEQTQILPDEIYSDLAHLFEEQKKRWTSVYRKTRDRYGEIGLEITTDLFMRYGKTLIKSGKLSENSHTIQYLLPTSLLINQDTLDIVIEMSTEVAQILSAAEGDYRQEFSNQALSVYNSRPELQDQMLRLLSALGIQIPSDDEKE